MTRFSISEKTVNALLSVLGKLPFVQVKDVIEQMERDLQPVKEVQQKPDQKK